MSFLNVKCFLLLKGTFSTPALNKIAKDQKKFLLSTESEIDW